MKKYYLVTLFLLTTKLFYSQFTSTQPFTDNKEDLNRRNQFFIQTRLTPYPDFNAFGNALEQKKFLRQSGFVDNGSSWISLGPTPGSYNSAPNSSRVRVVAYDPDSTNVIYIGTSNGGVWKSTDGGFNWVAKTDFEISLSSGALAVYNNWNTNPPQRIVYCGTGEGGFGFRYSYYGRGLLKSTDGGDTWKNILNGLPSTSYFHKIAINPASPNILLAALGTNFANPVNTGGLYRSEDYGESWTRIVPSSTAENGLTCSDVAFSPDGSKVYILGPKVTGSPNWWENGTGYRISTDGGITFTSIQTDFPTTGYLSISKSSPNIIFYIVSFDCNISHLYRSADAGYTWGFMNLSFQSNQCGYNMVVEVDPVNPEIVYAGTIPFYKSTDRGNNFISQIALHADVHDIAFNPKNHLEFIIATDGGVAKTTNSGESFINLNQTLTTHECYSVTSDPSDQYHLLAGTQDNGTQERLSNPPPDNRWLGISGYDVTKVIIDQNQPNRFIAQFSASSVGIHVTTNSGRFWYVSLGFPSDGGYAWVRPIIAEPEIPGSYFSPYMNDIYKTTDFGFTWLPLNSIGINEQIEELSVSNSYPDIMYAGTGPFEYMPLATIHHLYKSTDHGSTWKNINEIVDPHAQKQLINRYISAIEINKENENDVVVAFAGFGTKHIFRTTNGGFLWNKIDCNPEGICLPDVPVNDIVIYKNLLTNEDEFIIATDAGVFKRATDGVWNELADGLPNCIIMDLEIYGSKLRAATFGRGVFEWDLSGGSKNNSGNIGKSKSKNKIILYNNFPNPFNPKTNISFEIPYTANIKLTVFDVIGKILTDVLFNNVQAGKHDYEWDGENYSSGIYFYKLESKNFVEIKKMILIK